MVVKRFKNYLSLATALLLVGCPGVPGPINTNGQNPSTGTADLVSNNTAGFVGMVRVPETLISNNSGGLISNNAGGLVSNNSGSYRIAALDEIPLANSLVYLLSPNEHFYTDTKGQRFVTTTDASGSYKFDKVLPEGAQVIVSALLAGNRRMVGYTLAAKGDNQVNISVATTYVVEFFRAQAKAAGKNMSDYAQAMAKLPALVTETQALLDAGKLPLPDLTIGNAGAMNKTYFAVFASQSKTLSDGWADLLGHRMIPLTTVAGNYTLGSQQAAGVQATSFGLNLPTGVAVDTQGNIYVAVQLHHVVYKIAPDGTTTVLGKFRGDGSITTPVMVPGPDAVDGVAIADLSMPMPQDVATIGDNLVIVPSAASDATIHNNVLLFVCQTTGTYFGKPMTAGKVYRLGVDSDEIENDPVSRFKDGNVFTQARFRSPQGVGTDDAGNLFVADRRNNLIRRIDLETGEVTTIAGKLSTDAAGTYGDQLGSTAAVEGSTAGWNGVDNGDGGTAVGAIINRPYDVAWRRVGPTQEEVFVWEGFNPDLVPGTAAADIMLTGNAIRRVAFPSTDRTAGTISTLIGGNKQRGDSGDGGPAASALIKLVDPAFPDVPNAGIAVSPDGKYLYFCDSHNQRLRMVDLAAGTVHTVAGAGTVEGDTEVGLSALKDVSGLAVDAHGNVYFADAISNVVRRITYQYGR